MSMGTGTDTNGNNSLRLALADILRMRAPLSKPEGNIQKENAARWGQ